MLVLVRPLQDTWRLTKKEVGTRWGRFVVLTLLILLLYAVFIVSAAALSVRAIPNYFRWYDVIGGIWDSLTLSMSLLDRYELLSEQPLFEFGYVRPAGDGLIVEAYEGVVAVTLHVVLNLLLMSALIAAYCLLLGRYFRSKGPVGTAVGSSALAGGGGSIGVVTAGVASVACCGSAGLPAVLSLVGVGAGVGLFLAEYDRLFGLLGVLLMVPNLWIVARMVQRNESCCPT